MASVVCTGGLGFIGSHLVDLLVANDHEVLVIDDLSTGDENNLNPKTDWLNVTLGSNVKLSHYINRDVDYVFHLAALARIQPSIIDPIGSHAANLTGTLQVLELCREKNAKIIFSSSSSIYAGDELPTKESSKKDPKNPYALQKLMAEEYIQLYGKLYDLEYTILRYFNVFGPRQILTGAYAAVIGIFLDQYKNNKPLTITNDGEQKRDFSFVKDVARANLMAINWHRDVYNIGTGVNYSVNEIASMISKNTKYIGNREGEARQTLADISKARKAGWSPKVNIAEWISTQI